MVKHKFFINNFEKEEKWIEEYGKKGYKLVSVNIWTGKYTFEKMENNEFIPKIKIDYRTFDKNNQYQDYVAMFEDSGWKHIAGDKSNGPQYFSQMEPDVDDDIFSDSESKAQRYIRMSKTWMILFVVYISTLNTYNSTGIFNFTDIFHLKEMYYTPGLWEMKGLEFWGKFLFETPFALFRGMSPYIFLLIVLMYGWIALNGMYKYRKEKNGGKQSGKHTDC